MSGLSIDLSIAQLMKHVGECVDAIEYVIFESFYLKKAFDTVDTQILLTKMHSYMTKKTCLPSFFVAIFTIVKMTCYLLI